MHMTFWFSPDLGTFLFNGFNVQSTRAFIATCVALASMAILLEALKYSRTKMKQRSAASGSMSGGSETSALLSGSRLRGNLGWILNTSCEVLMYFTQESMNWLVMLAVMGYNGYIFLSVLAGAGLGYAIFGESIANARIHNLKLKAAMISCGECQVTDEAEDILGQSDPPADILPVPSVSGSVSPPVAVHSNP